MSGSHPSFLQLDRLAAGASVEDAVRDHVETCAECSAYVRELRTPAALPDWLPSVENAEAEPRAVRPDRSSDGHARPSRSGPRGPRRALRAMITVSAVAAASVAGFGLGPAVLNSLNAVSGPEYSTVRGEPSVGLYIKRGARVWLWDGQATIRPHDQLRLKVVPEGYRHVTVFTPNNIARLKMIYSARIDPRQPHLLPRAWRVDDSGSDERLVVVLAPDRTAAESLEGHPLEVSQPAKDTLWTRFFRLQKAKEANDD